MSRIAVIIPSLEPDERLSCLLDSLKEMIAPENVIIVNDGSGEAYLSYFEDARQKGCIVLRHGVNLGKGRALKTAFNHILTSDQVYEGAVIADSDGQHSPEDIQRCMEAMQEKPQSLILGCRDFGKENVPFKSRAGNIITRNVMKIFCGLSITDTQTGLRGIPRDFMKSLMNVQGERFEFETNMLLAAKEQQVPIEEIKIATIYIGDNSHSHFNPLKDSLRIYALFGKFIFASLSSFLVDIVLFDFFSKMFAGMQYSIFGATAFARLISSVYNYLINKSGVFHNREKHGGVLLRYYSLCIGQMLLSGLGVSLLQGIFHGSATFIKVFVDFTLFLLGFQIQREWVFKKNG